LLAPARKSARRSKRDRTAPNIDDKIGVDSSFAAADQRETLEGYVFAIHRRSFLSRLTAGAFAGLTSFPSHLGAADQEEWLVGLSGKHRQFLDVGAHDRGAPLKRAQNLLDAYRGAPYLLRDAEINVVFGAHGTTIPLLVGDEAWRALKLNEYLTVSPDSSLDATKNPYLRDASDRSYPGVATLQARGVRFIACRQSIARLSHELAAKSRMADAQAIQAQLLSGLAPGVIPVPAMIVAANRAQESGLSYVWVS
jgi:intracellular sulfur oxidation DsrE/DsrF family protein